jgi:putative tricarboxylic transport membrane protein
MTRTRRAGEVFAASTLCAIGVLIAVVARRLPYWHDYAPGPGFFPLWLGILLACTAAVELAIVLRRPSTETAPSSDPPLTRRAAWVGGLTVLAAVLVAPLGFVLATGVFVAAVSWALAPDRKFLNGLTTVLIPLVVWLVFVAWLGVPLPRGPLGF